MKKNFSQIWALILLIAVAVFAVPQARCAVTDHYTARFLTGTYLCVSNSTTLSATNPFYWYYSYSAGTNVLGGRTNSAGILIAPPITQVPLTANVNGDVAPNNYAIQFVLGYTNNLFWDDKYTPQVANLIWNITNVAPRMTVKPGIWTVTATLKAVRGDFPFNLPDSYNNGFSTYTYVFTYTNNAAVSTPLIWSTNIPAYLFNGTKSFAIEVTPTSGATNDMLLINAINLVGFK